MPRSPAEIVDARMIRMHVETVAVLSLYRGIASSHGIYDNRVFLGATSRALPASSASPTRYLIQLESALISALITVFDDTSRLPLLPKSVPQRQHQLCLTIVVARRKMLGAPHSQRSMSSRVIRFVLEG